MQEVHAYACMSPKEPWVEWSYGISSELQPHEVEIRVTHNGVCHSDLHMQNDDWGLSEYPLVAGHEVVGVVERIGDAVKGLHEIGEIVGVGWMCDSCGTCSPCLRGEENLCEKGYSGTIVGRKGGFQDLLRVNAKFAVKIPRDMPGHIAAPLLCAGITVFSPLRQHLDNLPVKPARVGIIGVGGLGHLAVQFAAKSFGAEVTAFSPFESQKEDCIGLGAKHFVLVTDSRAFEDLHGTFDFILSTSPVDLDWALYLSLLKNDGCLCLVGIPSSEINIPVKDLVFQQKKIVGSIIGGRRHMRDMFDCAQTHQVRPIVQRMPVSQINDAFEMVKTGKARFRIVLEH